MEEQMFIQSTTFWTKEQAGGSRNRHRDGDRQLGGWTSGGTNKCMDGEMDGHVDGQTSGGTEKWTDMRKDRPVYG